MSGQLAKYKKEGWIVADRRPIKPEANTRCFCCHRELKSLQAYRVRNDAGRSEITGPTCLEKVTGVKQSTVPLLGAYNTRAHGIPAAERASRHFGRAVDMPKIRNREARAIVALRTATLYAAGFDNMREGDLQQYRDAGECNILSENDVAAILDYSDRLERFDARHSPAHLRACNTVDIQIKALLQAERGTQQQVATLRHYQEQLHHYHVLTCRDMAQLQEWSKSAEGKFGIKNQIKALAFPVKLDRYEPLRFPPVQHHARRRGPAPDSGQQSFAQMNFGIVLRPGGFDHS